ncbi:proline--tRNA ligase [Candidatus Dependentiae bacterium]|jgi:prolyl-tRNA synthetase|nr:proline--tRNA ligase [Candidatus Dependentiae bacterium]
MSTLPDIKTNFAEWYQEVIVAADVTDASPTKGCVVIKPYGFAIWENIKQDLDSRIKSEGVPNAYFPLLIPQSFLSKEAKHVEGFSPELAVVTHGGGEKLEEPLVVRPTSETMIYHMFARWIKSWRDLPYKVNQWANVVRWEMRTRPFLRTLEFLWQEGHTAHRTREEAIQMAATMLRHYKEIYENLLAIPVVAGIKSESERFAGADQTYTIECLMPDGKALQGCTTHVLAHSFPQAFDVLFQDQDGQMKSPFCTSWGFTTRSVGAVIMMHGDQKGLVMPPKVAPIKAVIIPIYKTDDEKLLVLQKAYDVKQLLTTNGMDIVIDADDQKSPGSKFYEWELKGVPVRIEIGPKDLEKNQVVLVSRIEEDKTKRKTFVPFEGLKIQFHMLLDAIQAELFKRAQERVKSMWHQAESLEEFGPLLEKNNGLYQVGWCGSNECEVRVKEFKGTVRCLLEDQKHAHCFACKQASKQDILVAKAY